MIQGSPTLFGDNSKQTELPTSPRKLQKSKLLPNVRANPSRYSRKLQRLPTESVLTVAKSTAGDEARRLHEEIRIKAATAKQKAEEEVKRLRVLDREQQTRRQQEAKAQQKLREMGVFIMGYRWIKQSTGYRCAGGSHFVGNDALGL